MILSPVLYEKATVGRNLFIRSQHPAKHLVHASPDCFILPGPLGPFRQFRKNARSNSEGSQTGHFKYNN